MVFIGCLKKFCILIYNSDKSHFQISVGTDKYFQNPLFFSLSLCSLVIYISTCSRGWRQEDKVAESEIPISHLCHWLEWLKKA